MARLFLIAAVCAAGSACGFDVAYERHFHFSDGATSALVFRVYEPAQPYLHRPQVTWEVADSTGPMGSWSLTQANAAAHGVDWGTLTQLVVDADIDLDMSLPIAPQRTFFELDLVGVGDFAAALRDFGADRPQFHGLDSITVELLNPRAARFTITGPGRGVPEPSAWALMLAGVSWTARGRRILRTTAGPAR